MADNALVTPVYESLIHAIHTGAQNRDQVNSKTLPCTVVKVDKEFVTVKFEAQGNYTLPQVTIPQYHSEWMRPPTQVGDKGRAVPADFYLGGMSGDAGGTADFRGRGNLTPLVYHPISQKPFAHNTGRDLNAAFINGPNGVVMQDTAGTCTFTLTPSGVVIKIGGVTVTINGAGLKVTGGDVVHNVLTIGDTHVHGGVAPGGSNTGVPNP